MAHPSVGDRRYLDQMDGGNSPGEQRARLEQEQLSRRGVRILTGGLTDERDTFLIAAGAILLAGALYPLVGGWSLLAFPIVLIGAVFARWLVRRR